MRTYPHRPNPDALRAARASIAAFLPTGKKSRRTPPPMPADAERCRRLAEQRILFAHFQHDEQAPVAEICSSLHRAGLEFLAAVEQGYAPMPREIWHHAAAALAAGSAGTVQALATVPEALWFDPGNAGAVWLHAQIRAVFALARRDAFEADRWIGTLRELPLPAGLRDDAPLARNASQILSAIHARSAAEFNRRMAERMSLRTQSLGRSGTDSPLGLLDLDGLAFCRLAAERLMRPTVAHVTLPLEFLGIVRTRKTTRRTKKTVRRTRRTKRRPPPG